MSVPAVFVFEADRFEHGGWLCQTCQGFAVPMPEEDDFRPLAFDHPCYHAGHQAPACQFCGNDVPLVWSPLPSPCFPGWACADCVRDREALLAWATGRHYG